ncbi:MAG: hypothetical protein ACC700_13430 [Anaerolineales bacterium]
MRRSLIPTAAALAIAMVSISACGLLSGQTTSDPAAPSGQSVAPENGGAQPEPLLPSEATAAALPPGVLYKDDFSNPLSGWDVRNDPDAITDYRNGAFVIYVGKVDTTLWSKANRNMMDLIIDVDARQVGGPDDNLFGLICRYRDADNFYRFVIGGNGYAGITKRSNGDVTVLSGPLLTRSDAVNRGQATNHIRAICQRDQLTLYVNDQLVAQAADSDFPSGDIGLMASASKHPGVEIHFSEFSVSSP